MGFRKIRFYFLAGPMTVKTFTGQLRNFYFPSKGFFN